MKVKVQDIVRIEINLGRNLEYVYKLREMRGKNCLHIVDYSYCLVPSFRDFLRASSLGSE